MVAIENVLATRAALIDRELGMISYAVEPPELAEVIRYAISQKGKRIRASVLTLACEAVGGSLKKALLPALAVEMIHNTSLILDDVIDRSATRRGKETINARWGNNMAMIACDVMLALAIREASRTDIRMTRSILECASRSMMSLAEGEAMELVKSDYRIEDYYRIADRKTASLFSAAAETGALVGEGSEHQVNALRQYGSNIGLAFQIRDDILDFTASNDILGKPILNDLKMGRPTLIMLLAEESGIGRGEMLSMGPEDLKAALTPCIAKAGRIAGDKVAEARRSLEEIEEGRPKDLLIELSDYVIARTK